MYNEQRTPRRTWLLGGDEAVPSVAVPPCLFPTLFVRWTAWRHPKVAATLFSPTEYLLFVLASLELMPTCDCCSETMTPFARMTTDELDIETHGAWETAYISSVHNVHNDKESTFIRKRRPWCASLWTVHKKSAPPLFEGRRLCRPTNAPCCHNEVKTLKFNLNPLTRRVI